MKKVLENLFGVRRAPRPASRAPGRRPPRSLMAVEPLPDRIVPAISVTVDTIAGDLWVISDAAGDSIALTRDATGNIYVNGQSYAGAELGIINDINIYGFGGNDLIDVSGVYGYAGNSFLRGGADHDTLVGGSGSDWLVGDAGNDTLQFSAGNDTEYDGGADYDTLVGAPSAPNAFMVTGLNEGTVNARSFTAVESLRGGFGRDVFAFAPLGVLSGSINGGPGNDFLDYSLRYTGVYVNLTTGFATSADAGVRFVENVLGSHGDDLLVGNAASNVLVGNRGDDRLYGGGGRDVLIGGLGHDDVRGEAGDDLLVGARTVYDGNVPMLASIQNTWAGGGASPLTSADVIDDFDSDNLEGGPGVDVILSNPFDVVTP